MDPQPKRPFAATNNKDKYKNNNKKNKIRETSVVQNSKWKPC